MPTDHASDTGTGLDIEALSDQIGSSLFGDAEADTTETPEAVEEILPSTPPASPAPVAEVPVEDRVPETWPKEMHPHWSKTPKEVQTYWRTREKQMHDGLAQYKQRAAYGAALHEVLSPMSADLRAAGISEAEMVGRLLTAQRRLTVGSEAERRAAYDELGRNLGFLQQQAQAQGQPVAPEVRLLQDKLARVESIMAADQQHRMSQIKEVATKDVEAFASDSKAHPYFDEVADDIVRFIQQGFKLDEAYEKAVWANPVTRAKEITRVQTDHEVKLKENARLDALPKKRAASVNVHSKETRMAPTEPVGSLEDTLRHTLRSLKERGTT